MKPNLAKRDLRAGSAAVVATEEIEVAVTAGSAVAAVEVGGGSAAAVVVIAAAIEAGKYPENCLIGEAIFG
jgi:hypothetical protein